MAEGGGVSVSELAVGSGAGVVGGAAAMGGGGEKDVLRGAKRAVVIGIHGWFPGTPFSPFSSSVRMLIESRWI